MKDLGVHLLIWILKWKLEKGIVQHFILNAKCVARHHVFLRKMKMKILICQLIKR